MRLPRMTTRRWMIAVAVASLVMASGRLLWLSSVYRKAALVQAAYENVARTLQTFGMEMEIEPESGAIKAQRAADASVNQKTAEYRAALKRKYERAARFPWLPVEPDPPAPR